MGHEVIETPAIDQFVKESLTYTRGYVTSPLCRPSLASIFSGLHTPVHGITGIDLRDGDGDGEALNKRDVVFGFDGNHDIFDVNDRTANMESRYVVSGDWKLLLHDEKNYGLPYAGKSAAHPDNVEGKPELYDVKADPHEKKNLAESNPEKVAELTKVLDGWWKP